MEFKELMQFNEDSIYFIFGLARPKNNIGLDKDQRVFIRVPVREEKDLDRKIAEMFETCERIGLNMYVYISVNSRNTLNALDIMSDKLNAYNKEARRGKKTFKKTAKALDQVWYSCCMKPEARGTKYFLLDIDTKDPATREVLLERIFPYTGPILVEQETHNGYHWIVRPFDVRVIKNIKNVGIQKDGLLYLGCTGFAEE
ncbi:MAG: hypothetical protein PHN69_04500 [Candidatus Pacebacteria bacterium]|nr:hypothetical protein [Fermentimonas sp.]MDD4804414.1 hypothetical protein [Candidatus Paceibacterota bacterium]